MSSRTEYITQTPKKSTLFSDQYLRNHWTLDIGLSGYSGIVCAKEHSPEVRSFPPGTPCIYIYFKLEKIHSCHSVSRMLSWSYHRAVALKVWFKVPYRTAILRIGSIIIVWINSQPTKLFQLNIISLYVFVCVDCCSLTVKGNFKFGYPVVLSYNCVDSVYT